jgi:hypothetical protein
MAQRAKEGGLIRGGWDEDGVTPGKLIIYYLDHAPRPTSVYL